MGLQKRSSSEPENPEWVSIFITHDLQEAHIIAGKLRVHEIESMIQTVPGASALGLTLGNWGEINVLVEPTIYDAAYDILFPTDENQLGDYADTDDNMWHDDGDGDEYYIDDEEGDDE